MPHVESLICMCTHTHTHTHTYIFKVRQLLHFFFFFLSIEVCSLLAVINASVPFLVGEGNSNPLQCSCLENLTDGGTWWAAIYGVAQSRTQLKRLSSSLSWLEKEMATHSSVLAWRIPGNGEPGGLPSMGLHRVGHD